MRLLANGNRESAPLERFLGGLDGDLAPVAWIGAPTNNGHAFRTDRSAPLRYSTGRKGIAIPGRRPSGDPYIVHVMPLRNRTNRRGAPGEATAAVFLAERGDDPKHVVDAATILFELTPAEARIVELTIEGRSSAEITKILSISSNTLKSRTRHLLEKMGQRRGSDLFRLATRLSAPAGTKLAARSEPLHGQDDSSASNE